MSCALASKTIHANTLAGAPTSKSVSLLSMACWRVRERQDRPCDAALRLDEMGNTGDSAEVELYVSARFLTRGGMHWFLERKLGYGSTGRSLVAFRHALRPRAREALRLPGTRTSLQLRWGYTRGRGLPCQ
jgi:hypothetical protein